MTISKPDYSLLQNSILTKGAINEREVSREADRTNASIQGYVQGTMSLIKGAANIAADYISTQDAAQQARLKPELEAKSTYYNQLLNESIKNGTTTIGKDETGKTVVNYAPEVLEYRNSWLDDVNSRDGISKRTKDWASQQMDSVYNLSDEQVMYTIAANNASLASTDMDKTVQDAALISASQGSPEYLEKVISGLNISDQYKQAYRQDAMSIYDGEYQSLHSRDLATTEGIQAAYKYIDGLTTDSATKDTLKNNALAAYQKRQQAVQLDTQSRVSEMLEAGSSWTEIQQTLIPQGQNANERDLIKETIKTMQAEQVTGLCAPYLAQVQSGTATTDELQNIKTLLKSSKYMFSGGLEGTYETYMGLVDNAIADSKSRKSEDYTEANLLGQNLYNQWNQGNISGDDAISQMKAYGETHADELDVVNVMDNFVNQIIADKVPLRYRDYFKMKMSDFSTLYSSQAKALGYQPMNDDYTANYETLYKDTINFISANPDMTIEDIDAFMDTEMNGFFARYADAKALEDSQLPAPEPVQIEYNPTDQNNSIDTLFNNWDAGLTSTDETIQYMTMIMNSTTDTSVAKKASDRIAEIQKKKVPGTFENYYSGKLKNFDNLYLRAIGKTKLDKLDNDQYIKYLDDKAYYEGALADFIANTRGLNDSKIDEQSRIIMASFSQPYATEDNILTWGVDTATTKSQSFLDSLQSFKDTQPFRYRYNFQSGKIEYEWLNEKTQTNWDNVGRYGLQALKSAGYDVNSFGALEIEGKADPEMVFYSSDGKAMYGVSDNGTVLEIKTGVKNGMYFIDRTEVRPEQTHLDSATRGVASPTGSPRNYTFDESGMGDTFTAPTQGTNFTEQQEQLQTEKDKQEQAKKDAKTAANTAIVNERNIPHDEELDLYTSALRERGMDIDEARNIAPQIREEIERLKERGVPANGRLELAIINVLQQNRMKETQSQR